MEEEAPRADSPGAQTARWQNAEEETTTRKPVTSEPAPNGVDPRIWKLGRASLGAALALRSQPHPEQRHRQRSRHTEQHQQHNHWRHHQRTPTAACGERPACATLRAPTPSTSRTGALMETPAVRHTDEYLAGQLLGTQIAIRALILMHPDPTAASRFVAQEMERWIAKALASAHTNDWQLQGISAATKAMIPSEEDLVRVDPDRT